MIRGAAVAAAAAVLPLALAGCSGGDASAATPGLTVTGAYIPQPPTADLAGGFLTIENDGDADDTLTAVTSDLAGSVELHETTASNAMRQVDSLPIPAGDSLRLDRGGNHLMLLDLSRRPAEGETVSLTFRFATSDPITVDVPVEAATYTGERRTTP